MLKVIIRSEITFSNGTLYQNVLCLDKKCDISSFLVDIFKEHSITQITPSAKVDKGDKTITIYIAIPK